jgi:hypothetical protein
MRELKLIENLEEAILDIHEVLLNGRMYVLLPYIYAVAPPPSFKSVRVKMSLPYDDTTTPIEMFDAARKLAETAAWALDELGTLWLISQLHATELRHYANNPYRA